VRLWPRSLAAQIAVLIGAALFVAQAINFAFLLQERQARRLNSSTSGAIFAAVDAADRVERGQPPAHRRQRWHEVQVGPQSLARGEPMPEVEERLLTALGEAGLRAGRVAAAASPVGNVPAWRPEPSAAQKRQPRNLLIVSAELSQGRWVNILWPLPSSDWRPVWGVLWQTAIIFAALLLAAIWIGRYAARPLRALTDAAARFGPDAAAADPVPAQGPEDIRRLIASFNDMRRRIIEMLAEKDRMLGAIGHDLRTPLASLRLRAEGVEDEQERERMIATIEEMTGTLEDILSLARAGRSSEAPERVDLAALVDAVAEDLRALGHDVTVEEGDRLPVRLRPILVTRAVRNVIDNAVKYAGRARIRVRREGEAAIVEVEDEGPGIPEEDLGRVMEGFVRLETSRNRGTGGSGLGLTIARAILREEGGELGLENREGGGLKATLRLPIRPAQGG
jgi:signal transduction histidine kinase